MTAPAPTSGDMEHVVAAIPRSDGGELRVVRKTYNGSAPFTSIHRWFLDEKSGELRPGKQNVTIRDVDLPDVIRALQRIATKLNGAAPRPQRAPRPMTGADPSTAKSDELLREVELAF